MDFDILVLQKLDIGPRSPREKSDRIFAVEEILQCSALTVKTCEHSLQPFYIASASSYIGHVADLCGVGTVESAQGWERFEVDLLQDAVTLCGVVHFLQAETLENDGQ